MHQRREPTHIGRGLRIVKRQANLALVQIHNLDATPPAAPARQAPAPEKEIV